MPPRAGLRYGSRAWRAMTRRHADWWPQGGTGWPISVTRPRSNMRRYCTTRIVLGGSRISEQPMLLDRQRYVRYTIPVTPANRGAMEWGWSRQFATQKRPKLRL